MCPCMCLWRPKVDGSCILLSFSSPPPLPHFWDSLLLNLGFTNCLDKLSSPTVSTPSPVLAYRCLPPCPALYAGAGNLNLDITFSTNLFPKSWLFFPNFQIFSFVVSRVLCWLAYEFPWHNSNSLRKYLCFLIWHSIDLSVHLAPHIKSATSVSPSCLMRN